MLTAAATRGAAASAGSSAGAPPPAMAAGGGGGGGCATVRVTHTYAPATPDELPLRPGDVLRVLARFDDGWARAVHEPTGACGVFPLNFTVPCAED